MIKDAVKATSFLAFQWPYSFADIFSSDVHVNFGYIRHLSYCFYIAVNRICVAICRVDGALKPWSAIHLELATPHKNLHTWICQFQLCKFCFGSWGGRNHYYDSTAQMAMQQHVVEHGEHYKAKRSHGHPLSSRCLDTVLPLDPARSG